MIFVALIHFPVLNKRGEIINSAVTNLDMHDIARVARTCGVSGYYVCTPLPDQRRLAAELAGHWLEGVGGEKNPDRRDALGIVRIVKDLDDAVSDIRNEPGYAPLTYATSAIRRKDCISWHVMRELVVESMKNNRPVLIIFGTASGLALDVMERVDGIICPVSGPGSYNHLSVRSAASITLDRLLGRED